MVLSVNHPLRLGFVAGEASSDLLASDILKNLTVRGIPFIAEGIAGPEMEKQGCRVLFPLKWLSIMGLGEIIKQLPRLICLRWRIYRHFIKNPPDVFIGIDAPEFNLTLEKKLKRHHIRTIHYVSPSVWAWRAWRLKKIAKAVDLILTLFPFEQQFYTKHHIPVAYVGHPFADQIPFETDTLNARKELSLPTLSPIIALLPGSRRNEINYLGQLFLETAQRCQQKNAKLIIVVALLNAELREQFTALKLALAPQLSLLMIEGQARKVMAAADVILLASGTASLEGMLLKKPMVVAYRMSMVSYWMAKSLVKTKYIALPNLLADEPIVPEFIQTMATTENLSHALSNYLENPQLNINLQKKFLLLHQQLRNDASQKAVDAMLSLVGLKTVVRSVYHET